MAERLNNVLYVALARRSDGVTVASFGKNAQQGDVNKLISSPAFKEKATPNNRIRLVNKTSAFHMLSNDDGLVAVVVTTGEYPQRNVFGGLIADVFERFGRKNYDWRNSEPNVLTRKFKGDLKSICTEYDDPAAKNKIAKLNGQVNEVKGVMQNNLTKALENLEATEDLDEKAEDLMEASKDFNNKAKKLAWREWLMLQKMRCMIFAVFVIVIIIIVIAICADGKTCAGPSEPAASSEGTVTAAGAVSTPSGSRRLLY